MSLAEFRALEMPNTSVVTPKTIVAVGVVLPALAALTVALRFYVRISIKPSLGRDDYLILFALILTVPLGIMMIIAVHLLAQRTPIGKSHEGFVLALDEATVLVKKMKWAFDLTEIFALGTMKLSVIFFYRRVFRGQTFDFYSKTMIALVGVWITAFFLATLFECGTRVQYMWTDILDVSTQCTNSVMYHNAYAISDLITEVMILAMPIPIIWRLQMSLSQKLAVSIVFALGFVSVAAGLARITVQIAQLSHITSVSQNILIISLCTYWSMIEMGLSIVAACLPTLRPLLSNPSPPGWCRHLKSRTILSSKTSFPFSMRSKRSSDSDTTDSNDLPKQHGGLSSSSQNSIPPAKIRPLAISVYAMNDVEAQTDSPSWKSTVRDQIEHESLKQ